MNKRHLRGMRTAVAMDAEPVTQSARRWCRMTDDDKMKQDFLKITEQIEGESATTCDKCKGTGVVERTAFTGKLHTLVCNRCNGLGKRAKRVC